jgi:hypothetical protein
MNNPDYENGRTISTKDFNLVAQGADVRLYMEQLMANQDLFGIRDFRTIPRYGGELSPHRESQDIWVRHQKYADMGAYDTEEGKDCLMKPAISEWYPESLRLPAAKDMAECVCKTVGAVQMGGHYIIKIGPGKKVYPHRDFSWHSTYYNKYLIVLKTQPGVVFGWEHSGNMIPETGDLWNFENNSVHWVNNDSDEDLIIATFSIRTFDMDRQEAVLTGKVG